MKWLLRHLRGWHVSHIVLLVGALIMLFPMVWMFFGSFKTEQEMFDYPPQLLPKEFTLAIFEYMWSQRNFSRMFINSTIVSSAVTVLTVSTSAYNPSQQYDLTVLDDYAPTTLPRGGILLVNPPRTLTLVRQTGSAETPKIARLDRESPVLAGIDLSGLSFPSCPTISYL